MKTSILHTTPYQLHLNFMNNYSRRLSRNPRELKEEIRTTIWTQKSIAFKSICVQMKPLTPQESDYGFSSHWALKLPSHSTRPQVSRFPTSSSDSRRVSLTAFSCPWLVLRLAILGREVARRVLDAPLGMNMLFICFPELKIAQSWAAAGSNDCARSQRSGSGVSVDC